MINRILSISLLALLCFLGGQKAAAHSRHHGKLHHHLEKELQNNEELPADTLPIDTTIDVSRVVMSQTAYLPLVFVKYDIKLADTAPDPLKVALPDSTDYNFFFDREMYRIRRQNLFLQNFMAEYPWLVTYTFDTMPKPPQEFIHNLDPLTAKLEIDQFESIPANDIKDVVPEQEVNKIHWLNTFDGSLQFSQAYISPNWYQGGTSNLNMILHAVYHVQLNPKFHENTIADFTVSYKLGLNNAPDDSIHHYSISEDLLQANAKFGIKAARHWYYSLTGQFKTQILNNYKANSQELSAAILSPADLNLGVGMTYSYENRRKTLQFAASIAPASYNLKTCTNTHLDPAAFGIDNGHRVKNEIGSSVEVDFRTRIGYNVTYYTRVFAFTDYQYLQTDWEHTVDFAFNKFISARIYAHLRYDSSAPEVADTDWRRWMFKEILSIGFTYKFTRI